MALRGMQEYIARDVNNIARVEDEGNIVSIKGNYIILDGLEGDTRIYCQRC